ncbi:MAG: aminoglycoside 3'-phosphotransferase [bacterium]|jgi:aminoglycoside 3'-phosphotransferase II|nr:aminoglycoside 3'-phosphotransferase [bacterium]
MTHPAPIQIHLSKYTTSGENLRTSSQAQVYRYQKSQATDLFLKIHSGHTDVLLFREKEALDWLLGKLPVPRVVAYHETSEAAYLLTEALPGTSSESHPTPPEATIRILAEGLRAIHAVTATDCPLPRTTADDLILRATQNVGSGRVTSQSLRARGDHRTPGEALHLIQSIRPKSERLALTHGDYCLPNVLIDHTMLSGFVDWGSAGPGDPHLDLASAQYSIKRNLGDPWVDLFYDLYGRHRIDDQALAFYVAIYELV